MRIDLWGGGHYSTPYTLLHIPFPSPCCLLSWYSGPCPLSRGSLQGCGEKGSLSLEGVPLGWERLLTKPLSIPAHACWLHLTMAVSAPSLWLAP